MAKIWWPLINIYINIFNWFQPFITAKTDNEHTHTCKKLAGMQQHTYIHTRTPVWKQNENLWSRLCAVILLGFNEEWKCTAQAYTKTIMCVCESVCSLLIVVARLALIVSFSFCGVCNFVGCTLYIDQYSHWFYLFTGNNVCAVVVLFHSTWYTFLQRIEQKHFNTTTS